MIAKIFILSIVSMVFLFRYKEMDIALVYPKTEAEKMEYCLSDNDESGDWLEMELLEITYAMKDDFNMEDYNVDLTPSTQLGKMISAVGPDATERPEEKYLHECPECGHKY